MRVGTIIKLALVGLVLHATWKVGPVYLSYQEFKDTLEVTARAHRERPEAEIVDRVMELARSLEIPIDREAVRVRKAVEHTYVDVTYTQDLELLPRFTYPWTFDIHLDVWSIRPANEILGR